MKSNLFLLFVAVLFAACNSDNKPNVAQAGKIPQIVGQYRGVVPCADCEGIEYILTMNADFTFIGAMVYRGKGTQPVALSGKWSFTADNKIKLAAAPLQAGMDQFELGKNLLILLNEQGQQISGPLASRYILWKNGFEPIAVADASKDVFTAKKEAGVDFYALGTEPFWALEMDFDGRIAFLPMTGDTIYTLPYMGQEKDGVLRYESMAPSGRIEIEIKREKCSDGMSEREYDYSVTVVTNRENTYKGCGTLLGGSIGSYWVLQSMNGKEPSASAFPRGLPTLQMSPADKQYVGTDGCNTLGGKFILKDASVKFEEPFMTRMACPGNASKTYRDALLAADSYKIDGMNLTLSTKGKPTLVFGLR